MSSCLPLLVFHHHPDGQEDGDDDEMLMFSISKQTLHKNMEHDLLAADNSMCWTTAQGWILLLAQDHGKMSLACLWNPSTGNKLPLPDLEEEHQIPYHCRCLLSHKDLTHPGCVVVLFNNDAPDLWYCHTGGGGDSSSRWRHCSYDVGNHLSIPEPPKGKKARLRCRRRPTKTTITFMASVQGKIYFTNLIKGMYAMDFSSCTSTTNHQNHPTFQKFSVPLPNLPKGFSVGRHWLLESQDQLFLVTTSFVGFDLNNIGTIEVHRMDFSSTQACWRSVHDIGDVVFLLEDTNMAASCSASALGLKANQIFLLKNSMDDDGADLCIFDLETNTQEITRVHHHNNLILWRKPFWIVPPS
jgi:hypothetical protein